MNMSISGKPDVTLIITDGDLVDLMTGKLNSQKAFFQGKLKVTQTFIGTEKSRVNSRKSLKIKEADVKIGARASSG